MCVGQCILLKLISAEWASIIIIASAFITTSYVEDKSMVPAAAIGAFIGTAATVYYKKRKENDSKG